MENKTESEKIIVTKHAIGRFKKRLGLKKRACQKQADNAFYSGFKHKDAHGKAKKYVDALFLKYKVANNIRIYNKSVYIFAGYTLITVMAVPKYLLAGFK